GGVGGGREGGGGDGFADLGGGAGDEQQGHAGTAVLLRACASTGIRTSARVLRSAAVRSARAVRRSREVPSGTEGGRKHPTSTPCSRQVRAASWAICGSPRTIGTTAESGAATPAIRAISAARSSTRGPSPGSRRRIRRAARAAPTAAGASPVSKIM